MRSREGEIESSDSSFVNWAPQGTLPRVSSNHVRFSLGFLRSDFSTWFGLFQKEWEPLLRSLGVSANLVEVNTGFEFPDHLSRITPVEVDSEIAVVGMDEIAEREISSKISLDIPESAQDLLIEYFERRLISTFSKGWTHSEKLECSFIAPEEAESAEVVGVIELVLSVNSTEFSIWFGIGPRLTEKFDRLWRAQVAKSGALLSERDNTQAEYDVSIELSQLAVSPAKLIDYLRAGTVINLKDPIDVRVKLLMDDEVFAEGELCQFDGCFAVQITSTSPRVASIPEATTRVQVILAKTNLDKRAFLECHQEGACLLTDVPVSNIAFLRISGEDVAKANLGVIDGLFALNVLPK